MKGIVGWCVEGNSIDVAFRTVEAIPRVKWRLNWEGRTITVRRNERLTEDLREFMSKYWDFRSKD